MPDNFEEHQFTIKSTFADVSDLAETAARLCAGKVGTADLSDSLRLCLAEALNNVVEHAYSGDQSRRIDVSLKLGNDGYRVTVRDSGAPMPDGIVPPGEIDLDVEDIGDLPEGGFGWMLIRNEVDHLDYERSGEHNILVLDKATHV